MMGWNLVVWLYLVCGVVAMAGVLSQDDSKIDDYEYGDGVHYQPLEGDMMHSIMRSWVNASTNASFLTSDWGWSFKEHPCFRNDSNIISWEGIACDLRSYQLENGSFLQYYTLTTFTISDDSTSLFGELSAAILNLTELEELSINNAIKLSGPLPQGIFCTYGNYGYKALTKLSLYNCSFNGDISLGFGPDSCSNEGLQSLDLSWNSFTSIDAEYSFYTLQSLNVSNNKLKGDFYIGGYLIKIVDLSNNFLSSISITSTSQTVWNTEFTTIFAQNNSIIQFPTEFFQSSTLQEIYLDSNHISSISKGFDVKLLNGSPISKISMSHNLFRTFPEELLQLSKLEEIYLDSNRISSISNGSNTEHLNVSSLRKISMSHNLIQAFPEDLLQLPNLEEIILDFNNITGTLTLPNISCKYSSIKLISILSNRIAHLYPSKTKTSCFSEPNLLSSDKLFLAGNPICKNRVLNTSLLLLVCRFNASSPRDLQPSNMHRSNKVLITIMACVSPIVAITLIVAFCVIQKLRKKISFLRELQIEFDKRNMKPNLYSFSELRVATQDFHVSTELGRGGFGIVYKGILSDGSIVAVKKLTKLSVDQGIQEFLNEIIAISNIKHRNLVQLKGCCIRENQRILVYEFVENENLANALWGDSTSNLPLDWYARFNIILGTARGLAYLHEEVQPAIIHRDIKGPNILLDKDCNPKIADFGLALFFPSLDDGETHMSVSKVAGTMGYMAPEYVCYGQVSTKLDVFSFGILLLEIVSGRKNIDFSSPTSKQYLVHLAQESYTSRSLSSLKDKSLEEMTLAEDVSFKQVVEVGLQCVHHIPARRPTMSEVVAMLVGNKKVEYYAFEDNSTGSTSLLDMGSSSSTFATNSYSRKLGEDDGILNKQVESHKQALQLSEMTLLDT